MAYCKICDCGKMTVRQDRGSFPTRCEYCSRNLPDESYNMDDPRLEEILRRKEEEKKQEPSPPPAPPEDRTTGYVLRLSNGKIIPIPDEGGTIGRTELGAEELAEFPSVSREHLRVTVAKNIGVLVEDISSYGTFIDGRRLIKYMPESVACGATITLCNVDAVLLKKEDSDQ